VLCTSVLLSIPLRSVGLAKVKHALFGLGVAIGCAHAERSHQTLTAAQVSVTLIRKFVTDQCDLSGSRVLCCGNYPGPDTNGLPGTRKQRVLTLSIQMTYELDKHNGEVVIRINVPFTFVYVHGHFTFWKWRKKLRLSIITCV
jgi:hypothetical protein